MKTGNRIESASRRVGVSAENRCRGVGVSEYRSHSRYPDTPIHRYSVTPCPRFAGSPVRRFVPPLMMAGWLIVCAGHAQAGDLQVSASLDRNPITTTEQAVLSVTVSGAGGNLPDPQLPALPDFQVYNAGRSQNFTWINGKASSNVTHNFVLTPSKEGQFNIPPVRVSEQGQTVESSALALVVTRGDPSAVQGSARPEGAARPAPPGQGAHAVFIAGTVDKASVYVGEPLVFTFRLFNRVPLLSQPRYQPPEMTGFWTEDLPPQRNFTTSYKGMPYNVTEVRTALFPSAPGKSQIGSARLNVNLENFGTDPFGSNFFAQFFGRGEEKELRTEPISIHVKALPSPKPADFSGAVGTYSLSAQVDKPKIAVGQPLTLSLTIAGRGHIKSIPDLPLPSLTNFRTFDASAATNIEKKEGTVEGSKVFKTVLIPTASGDLTIPQISFTYFDLSEHAYRTARSRPLVVHVSPAPDGSMGVVGPAGASGAPLSGFAQPGIKRLGEDIRYIHTPDSISSAGEPLYRRTWYRVLHLILVGLLALGGAARLYFRLFMSNTALYRFRKAFERAQGDIRKTEECLSRRDMKGAGSHLANVLQEYLAAKLGIGTRTRSLKQIVDALKARGLSDHSGEKIRNIWETLDLYQFAPAQVQAEDIRSSLERVSHVLEEVEKEVQWKN